MFDIRKIVFLTSKQVFLDWFSTAEKNRQNGLFWWSKSISNESYDMAKYYLKTYRLIQMMFLHFFLILLFTHKVGLFGVYFFMLKAFQLVHRTSRGRGGSWLSLYSVASSKWGGLWTTFFIISLQNNLAGCEKDQDLLFLFFLFSFSRKEKLLW